MWVCEHKGHSSAVVQKGRLKYVVRVNTIYKISKNAVSAQLKILVFSPCVSNTTAKYNIRNMQSFSHGAFELVCSCDAVGGISQQFHWTQEGRRRRRGPLGVRGCGPLWEQKQSFQPPSSQGPSCCEATVLTAEPPCCQMMLLFIHQSMRQALGGKAWQSESQLSLWSAGQGRCCSYTIKRTARSHRERTRHDIFSHIQLDAQCNHYSKPSTPDAPAVSSLSAVWWAWIIPTGS